MHSPWFEVGITLRHYPLPRSFIVDLDHDRTDHIRDYSTTLQLQAPGPCDGPSEKSKLYQDISTTVVSISTAMSAYPLS